MPARSAGAARDCRCDRLPRPPASPSRRSTPSSATTSRRLPGGIFSRAFVRGYAQEVGLDPEETVRDFVEQFPVEAVTYGSPLVETPEPDARAHARSRSQALAQPARDWRRARRRRRRSDAGGALGARRAHGLGLVRVAACRRPRRRRARRRGGGSERDVTGRRPRRRVSAAAPAPVIASGRRPCSSRCRREAPCWVRIVSDGVVATRAARRRAVADAERAPVARASPSAMPARARSRSMAVARQAARRRRPRRDPAGDAGHAPERARALTR